MQPSFPFPLIRFAEVASTNEVASDLARQGAEAGTVVLARQQGHGRGRGSNIFCSPPGGLYMSVIVRPVLPPEQLPLITLAAGVACARCISELSGVAVALKWPNDLYLNDRKLGGILAETGGFAAAPASVPYVVLGVGINVNSSAADFPQGLRHSTTSLYDATSRHQDLDFLLTALHQQLTAILAQLQSDVSVILQEWQERDCLLGRWLSWRDGSGRILQGRGAGLAADGCYQVRAAEGNLHTILAGEVSLGPLREQR